MVARNAMIMGSTVKEAEDPESILTSSCKLSSMGSINVPPDNWDVITITGTMIIQHMTIITVIFSRGVNDKIMLIILIQLIIKSHLRYANTRMWAI